MSGRSRRGRPPHEDVLTPTEWRVVHAVQHADGTQEWMAHFHDPEGRPMAIMSQVKPRETKP